MDPKALKKLVKVCREMGVKSYKGDGFEFTLTDDAPRKATKKSVIPTASTPDEDFETDSLTQEQILMWSAAPGGAPFPGEQEEA